MALVVPFMLVAVMAAAAAAGLSRVGRRYASEGFISQVAAAVFSRRARVAVPIGALLIVLTSRLVS